MNNKYIHITLYTLHRDTHTFSLSFFSVLSVYLNYKYNSVYMEGTHTSFNLQIEMYKNKNIEDNINCTVVLN